CRPGRTRAHCARAYRRARYGPADAANGIGDFLRRRHAGRACRLRRADHRRGGRREPRQRRAPRRRARLVPRHRRTERRARGRNRCGRGRTLGRSGRARGDAASCPGDGRRAGRVASLPGAPRARRKRRLTKTDLKSAAMPMPSRGITIKGRRISSEDPPYVIAEMSGNHNGDIGRALRLIDAAAAAGADAVKLQTYTADTITLDHDGPGFRLEGGLWAGRRLYDLYREAHTPWEWHPALFRH